MKIAAISKNVTSAIRIFAIILSIGISGSAVAERGAVLPKKEVSIVATDQRSLGALEAQLISAIKRREIGFTETKNGQIGLQVNAILEGSYFNKLGLKNGDTLFHFDKLSIEEYMNNRGRIAQAPRRLSIVRNEKPRVVLLARSIEG